MSTKRKYRRRSEEERIAELEARIEELKAKVESKKRKDSPLIKQIPRLQTRLRKFAQLALECDRPDVANTTTAFVAGLDRIANADQATLENWSSDDAEL